jgi:hypothetical protein
VSVQPELVDPRTSAFLASDPNLRSPVLYAPPPPPPKDESHLIEIAIGISAAFIAWRLIVRHRLQQERPRTESEARNVTLRVIKSLAKAWESLSMPPVTQAYSVVPYKAVQSLAIDYATELGQYINDTSVDALLEGFSSQINAGVGEGLAWDRAVNGYGLDPRQMKTYISNLLTAEKPRYGEPAVPPNVQASLDRAVLTRADRLGMNESFKAVQVGKNMTWMAMEAGGDLPEGTKKKWVTAEDERVCEVCGPLDGVTIPLSRRFKAINGERFYAPGVHPRCRCELELVYPPQQFDDIVKAMRTKSGEWDKRSRNKDGEFSSQESRTNQQEAPLTLRTKAVAQEVTLRQKADRTVSLRTKPVTLRTNPVVLRTNAVTLRTKAAFQGIADDLEAAATPPAPEPGWNYEDEVLIPATAYIMARAAETGKPAPLVSWLLRDGVEKEMPIYLGGRVPAEAFMANGRDRLQETDAFKAAYNQEVVAAAKDALEFNEQADRAMGGRVNLKNVEIPSDADIRDSRNSMAGLTRKQLLYVMEMTLEDAKGNDETFRLISPHDDENESIAEIIEYYEHMSVDDVATQILMAAEVEKERRYQRGLHQIGDWEHALKTIDNSANLGTHAHRRSFRGSGSPDYKTATAVFFRLANGWHGEQSVGRVGLDTASVDGKYKAAKVTMMRKPKPGFSKRPGAEYIEHVAIIDLIPFDNDSNDPGLDFVQA